MINDFDINAKVNKYGNKLQDKKVIRCPFCQRDYLPCELLYPNNVIGKTKKIIRDPLGAIIYTEYEEGNEPTSNETFTCENCGKDFVINYTISYSVSEVPDEINFSKETTSLW